MGRNSDKIIHLFRIEGTLVPDNLTMDHGFDEWFSHWAKFREYALISNRSTKNIRSNIPEWLLHKSSYTFLGDGEVRTKYAGLKWMKPQPYDVPVNGPHTALDFLRKEFKSIVFFSNRPDKDIRDKLSSWEHCSHYTIEEWKDTALYMKRLMWERGERA